MKISVKILCLSVIFVISACDRDKSLSPPRDTKHITIKIHSTSDMDILPVNVMYRSEPCSFNRHGSGGREYKVAGHNSMLLPVVENNSFSVASVPVDGGGSCNWKLSNVTVKFKYDKNKFDKLVDDSIENVIILIFDDHLPQDYNGNIKSILSEHVNIVREYFPWIHTDYFGNHGKKIDLNVFGDLHLYSYRVKTASSVTVWLTSNYDKVIYSEGPKVRKEIGSNHIIFKYPDGSIDPKGRDFPDFKKLQAISRTQ
ncbi:hypothetical protein PT300_10520 [Enterobacteriaceae bacterium ESL0689]|nr:hypothetical protein [Enterobacteriaceae bacterium ESL0689]